MPDLDPDIYRAYTGHSNHQVFHNLQWLASHSLVERVIIRLPLIPHYNTDADRDHSQSLLADMGFHRFDRFDYVIREQG